METDQLEIESFDFWKETLVAFSDYQIPLQPKTDDTLTMPVWYNDKIEIDGKSVYLKNLWVRGVRFISDFVDNTGSLLTYTDFCDLFHIHLPFTTF